LATVLILASALLHAVVNSVIRGRGQAVFGRAIWTCSVGGIAAPAIFLVPWPATEVWTFLAFSIPVHLCYQICLIEMYERADLTVVYPIARGLGPMGVALWSWSFLSGAPEWNAAAGVFLICGGIFSLAFGSIRQRHTIVPVSAILFAMGTGLGIAGYTLIDAGGVRASGNAWTYLVWLQVLHAIMMMSYGWMRKPQAMMAAINGEWRPWVTAGLTSLVGYSMALYALRIGDTAEVAALRETSILFAMGIGAVFLHERVTWVRVAAGCAIALGAVVLKMG
jgi:drug/metabolite transporter (DMT)-like permease